MITAREAKRLSKIGKEKVLKEAEEARVNAEIARQKQIRDTFPSILQKAESEVTFACSKGETEANLTYLPLWTVGTDLASAGVPKPYDELVEMFVSLGYKVCLASSEGVDIDDFHKYFVLEW
jgi:hypothetical protein